MTVPLPRWALTAALVGLVSSALVAEPRTVTLLYTNDIESVYEPVEAFWDPQVEAIGGIPHLATLIAKTREEEELSFLFDAGDIYTGALSQATEGRLPFDLYGLMGYDAVNLGNHEFEYGWESLWRVHQRARFPVLCANVFYAGADIPFTRAYTILEKEGFRVGVVGAMGVDAFVNAINPAHVEGLEVRDPTPIVQQWVDALRGEVDLVVVLTHQNRTAPMQTDKEADPEVQRGFDEDWAMAGTLRGVDVILGGHSDHGLWEPARHPVTGTLVGLTFGQGKYLGRMRLAVEEGTVTLEEGELLPVAAEDLPADAATRDAIRRARDAHPELTEVVASIDRLAFRRYYRESNLGNLLADTLREASGVDVAIFNSGSLRADFNPGEITVEEVLNVYPFIGPYVVTRIDGRALHELLEYGYALHYGLAQASGVETTYDSRRPAGERLQEVSVGGEPLDPDRLYTVASSQFLANGGDGYAMLAAGERVRVSHERLSEALLTRFRGERELRVPDVGRQRDLARGAADRK